MQENVSAVYRTNLTRILICYIFGVMGINYTTKQERQCAYNVNNEAHLCIHHTQSCESNKHYILWMCLSILVLVIQHAKCTFSMQHCIVICGLSGATLFFRLYNKWHNFKKFEYKTCFDFLYNVCMKHLNLRRYHECTPNIM
jgi:hypothetical protein